MDINKFMNEKYQDLAERDMQEQRNVKFTVTLNAGHKFMLEEIAIHMETSLTTLAGELLENITQEMIITYGLDQMEKLCTNAESKTAEYFKKVSPNSEYYGEFTAWPHTYRCYRGDYDKPETEK